MKYFVQIGLLCLACVLITQDIWAQVESDERALIQVKEGISISDSLFLLNLRFRMQNRMGFQSVSEKDLSPDIVEARVRRLRLRFDGYVLSSKVQYYIQLSFSRADQDLETGEIAQTVRDAMLYYNFSKNFYVGFGQGKLPGNRQRVISSGNLQFAERSLANARFTLDRDFGFFAYYTPKIGKQYIAFKTAFTSGDGRNALPTNNGMSYTGRIEWFPLGAFSGLGDYSEGDLFYEEKPKISIAAGYNANFKAYRSGGQLGRTLYKTSDINTFIADVMFKYRGWALLAEYFQRDASNAVGLDSFGLNPIYVYVGEAVNIQLSKMLGQKNELAVRYTWVNPSSKITFWESKTEEYLVGYSRYFREHRIKAQINAGYRNLNTITSPLGHFNAMFQVEFGI